MTSSRVEELERCLRYAYACGAFAALPIHVEALALLGGAEGWMDVWCRLATLVPCSMHLIHAYAKKDA